MVGGDQASAKHHLLVGLREVAYQRSLPLTTRDLPVLTSELSSRAEIAGAAVMISEQILSPPAVDQAIAPSPDTETLL